MNKLYFAEMYVYNEIALIPYEIWIPNMLKDIYKLKNKWYNNYKIG